MQANETTHRGRQEQFVCRETLQTSRDLVTTVIKGGYFSLSLSLSLSLSRGRGKEGGGGGGAEMEGEGVDFILALIACSAHSP